jgi:hypothetical protein
MFTNTFVLLLSTAMMAAASRAPEIDPATGGSAIATVGAVVLILRSQIRKRKR